VAAAGFAPGDVLATAVFSLRDLTDMRADTTSAALALAATPGGVALAARAEDDESADDRDSDSGAGGGGGLDEGAPVADLNVSVLGWRCLRRVATDG
jgi:hypothetical protein